MLSANVRKQYFSHKLSINRLLIQNGTHGITPGNHSPLSHEDSEQVVKVTAKRNGYFPLYDILSYLIFLSTLLMFPLKETEYCFHVHNLSPIKSCDKFITNLGKFK